MLVHEREIGLTRSPRPNWDYSPFALVGLYFVSEHHACDGTQKTLDASEVGGLRVDWNFVPHERHVVYSAEGWV